jgi:hypothetical protein
MGRELILEVLQKMTSQLPYIKETTQINSVQVMREAKKLKQKAN